MSSCFCGVMAKGVGGSNAHAIIWGKIDRESESSFARSGSRARGLAFWPGGGGELDAESEPRRGYSIMFQTSTGGIQQAPMKEIDSDVFAYTLTVRETGIERFQICLDGNSDRVLHPGVLMGMRDKPVLGPDTQKEAAGKFWAIDTRATYVVEPGRGMPGCQGNASASVFGPDAGQPGDRFQVQLMISGKYRAVTWTKAEKETSLLGRI
ncbi:unnamed protein product [Polarella glacialis]|uniref:Uncharacterized protein n=1 Tax=Polarella glacialis TaxID=89957 RepID=A0A813GH63_POLGL|nr:unnamed protein product [Polarella glacialis]